MEEMKAKIEEMISDAVSTEKSIEKKLEKLRQQEITVSMCDKWNELVNMLHCANERVRTLYEVRGKLGI